MSKSVAMLNPPPQQALEVGPFVHSESGTLEVVDVLAVVEEASARRTRSANAGGIVAAKL